MASKAGDATQYFQTEDIIEMADIKLHVGGETLQASRTALSINSPVFKAMFKHNFKEKMADEIDLPGKDYNIMVKFLEIIHGCEEVNPDNVFDVVPVFHEYQCFRLLKQCEQIISSTERFFTPFEAWMKTLALASQYSLEETKQKCIKLARFEPVSKLKGCKELKNVRTETYLEFLETSIHVKDEDLAAIAKIFSGEACDHEHESIIGEKTLLNSAGFQSVGTCGNCRDLLYDKAREIFENYG